MSITAIARRSKVAEADPIALLRAVRAKVEAMRSEARAASEKARIAGQDLPRLEAAGRWIEAEHLRGQLPGLQRAAVETQELARTAEPALVEAETQARKFLQDRHRPHYLKLLDAIDGLLNAAEVEKAFRITARTTGAIEVRNDDLGPTPPSELLGALDRWLRWARSRMTS